MEDIKHYIYQMLLGVKTLKSIGIFHRDVKPGNFLYNIHEKKGILIDYGLSEIDDKYIESLKEQMKNKKDSEIQKKLDLYQNIKKCEKIVGKNKIGTESFMPLESILRYKEQGYQVDIWPIGVVFLQFLLKKYNIFNNVRMQNKPNQNKNNHNKSGQIKNTYFITFILELANIFGSEAVIDLCRKYEYEVTLPNELPTAPINFKDIIKKEDFDDTANDLLTKLIALDQNERITVEDALKHPFFDSVKDFETKKLQQQLLQYQQIQSQQIQKMILLPSETQQIQQQVIKKPTTQQNNLLQANPNQASVPSQQVSPLMNHYQQLQFAYSSNQGLPAMIHPMQPLSYNPAAFAGLQQPAIIPSVSHQQSFSQYANKNPLNMQPPQ